MTRSIHRHGRKPTRSNGGGRIFRSRERECRARPIVALEPENSPWPDTPGPMRADASRMRTGSRPWRMVAILTIPLALWAALPVLQFCRFGWDEVRPECLLGMLVTDSAPVSHANAAPATPCSARTGCPFAAGSEHSIPIADAECARVDAPAHSASQHAHGGRAYCLGGPN